MTKPRHSRSSRLKAGVLSLCATLWVAALSAAEHVIVSVADQVLVYSVDAAKGQLTRIQSLALPDAGPQAVTTDQRTLYISSKVKAGDDGKKNSPAIATLRLNAEGRLDVVANLPVTHGPAYLSLDPSERWLSGSHYGPGMMSVWRIADGRCTGEAVVTRKVDKHAHSSVFSPDGRFLVVPTTLPNRVYQFRFDATTGNATPNDPPFADGPAASNEARQPWHLIFHPTLPIAYTSNEREHPGIGVWRWDAATGQLNLLQQVVSTRPGFTGVITTADLHLTPDGRFLYLSNRDVTDRKATSGTNDLVSFRVDAETGHLTLIAHTPCEHVPRSFAISPTGAWLCVAGTGDGQLGLYRIDPDSGALTRLTQAKLPGRPSWVSIVNW